MKELDTTVWDLTVRLAVNRRKTTLNFPSAEEADAFRKRAEKAKEQLQKEDKETPYSELFIRTKDTKVIIDNDREVIRQREPASKATAGKRGKGAEARAHA